MICRDKWDDKPLQSENNLAADEKPAIETGRLVKIDRVEEGAHKTVRTTETWRKACTRIRKSCYFCQGVWKRRGGAGGGRMQKPHGRGGASTQAMQTQLLILFCKVVSQTFGPHRIQKAIDAASTSWKCSRTGRHSAASQADGMAFYRWKVRVSWRCIYRYFRWVGFLFRFLPDRMDACWDVASSFLSRKGVPPSSCHSSSRGPDGRTAPGSCRKPVGSPQEKGVSGKAKQKQEKYIYLKQKTNIVHEVGQNFSQ